MLFFIHHQQACSYRGDLAYAYSIGFKRRLYRFQVYCKNFGLIKFVSNDALYSSDTHNKSNSYIHSSLMYACSIW